MDKKIWWRWPQVIKKGLQKAEMSIGVFCMAVMFIIMILNVFFRYILYKPIFWSDELNNYLFIWIGFLASAYTMGNDGHVRVDAILFRLPRTIQHIIKLAMDTIMLGMFLWYIYPSFRILSNLKLSNMMRIPLKYVYVIVPIAFTLMSIHIVINMFQEIYALFHPETNQNSTDPPGYIK